MDKDLLTVGNINLYEFTEDKSNFLIDNSRNIIISNPYDSKEKKEFYLKHDSVLISKFVGKTCAEFKIFAEYKIAIKYSENECERVLDLLRYAVSSLYHKDHRVLIGKQGEIQSGIRNTLGFKSDFGNYYVRDESVGALRPLVISDKTITTMRKINFFKVSMLLKKSELTEFERTILIAIHWFSDSQNQKNLDNEFLGLMICIEIFLTPTNQGDSITSFISEATAIILNKDLERRRIIRDLVEDFYDKRSKIVHGKVHSFASDDVDILRSITKTLIWWMIENKLKFESTKELVELIRDQMKNQKLTIEI